MKAWIARVGLSALSLFILAGTPATAMEPEAKAPEAGKGEAQRAPEAKLDKAALDRLKAMTDFYKGLKHFSVTTIAEMKGMPGEGKSTSSLVMASPNKLRLESGKDAAKDQQFLVVSDGKALRASGGMYGLMGSYLDREAPASFDDLAQDPDLMMAVSGGPHAMLPMMLTREDMLTQMTSDMEALSMGAPEMVDGVEVQKFTLTTEGSTGHMLIQTGDKPWLRRIAFTEGEGDEKMSMQLDMVWADEKPSDTVFEFKAPEGLKAVKGSREMFGDMGGGAAADDHGHGEAHETVGQIAPAVKLPYITGGSGEFDLSKHKDKDVVILDFWATWCGPCIKGLPIVTKVADAFKDKNVVFYAVNVGEEPEKVKAFMEKKAWGFTAVSDQDNKVSEKYEVEGIPHTVIIDKKGVIRQVHVGLIPNLEKQLTLELEAVLAGKDPLHAGHNHAEGEGHGEKKAEEKK